MSADRTLDAAWRRDHPLPPLGGGLDKEERGRVLLVGGSAFVPGALRLTGEALLRAGAGKVQAATVAAVAMALGVLMPEMAMIALPADAEGEIAAAAVPILEPRLDRCDTLVLGCGMMKRPQTLAIVRALLGAADHPTSAVIDAGALTAVGDDRAVLQPLAGRLVLTPHHGELAFLMDVDRAAIGRDPEGAARAAARSLGAIVVLKAEQTVIADPAGGLLRYADGAPGLGTAGSGDVLAGIVGGLLARGAAPLVAAGWGVWLHGEAGQAAAARIGPLGFIASDLLLEIPRLMAVPAT